MIMNFIKQIFHPGCCLAAACVMVLTACVPQTNVSQPKTTYAVCAASCEQRSDQCNASCRNNCQQCQAFSKQTTMEHYRHYVHEQNVKGRSIARDLNSYRDPLQCRKITCNCRADYRVCIQSCGGVVKKQLQAAPYCQ